MPFHPLQDSDPDKPRLADLGLLIIRLLSVATFFYYQLVELLGKAVSHIWDASDWDLVGQLSERGLPMPGVIAVAGVGFLAISLLGVFLGFFSRFNALLVVLMTGFVLFSAIILSPTLNPQALVLYLAIFAGFSCGGGGRLSLDYLLADRRARRRGTARA